MSSVSTCYAPGQRCVQAACRKISDAPTDHLEDQDSKCSSSLFPSLLDLILLYHGLMSLIILMPSALFDFQLFWLDRRTSVPDPLASNSAFNGPVNCSTSNAPLKPSASTVELTKCLPCDKIFTGLPFLKSLKCDNAQRSRTVPTDLTSTKVAPGISAIVAEAQRTLGHFCLPAAQLTTVLAGDFAHDGEQPITPPLKILTAPNMIGWAGYLSCDWAHQSQF